MTPILRRTVAVTAAVLALATSACGDDDDSSADGEPVAQADDAGTDAGTDTDTGDDAAYCEASLAIEVAPEPEIDFETATEAEIAEGLQGYAADVMQPLVDDVMTVVPAEIETDAETLASVVAEVAETGDPSAFESPDFAEAEGRVHEYDLATCGWEPISVEATEYHYDGFPAELDAGPTSFELTNAGEELHELGLVRVNDGVTETTEELLALPEDQVMAKVTFQGSPLFADPGASDYKVVDLTAGRYIVACFIPVGMTSQDTPPPADSPPHAFQGMVSEFTVG